MIELDGESRECAGYSRAMTRIGVPLALLSAVLFGASTPFAKLLLGSIDPWMMAGLLYLGAGIGLAAIHGSRAALRLPAAEAPLRRADLSWLALVILAGGIGGPLLLMFGLARTDATSASLLLNLAGLSTMSVAWIAFRENVDRRLLLGAFAILAGAVLLSWHGRASLDLGARLIAGACLCWGIDNNLTRKLSFVRRQGKPIRALPHVNCYRRASLPQVVCYRANAGSGSNGWHGGSAWRDGLSFWRR